MRNTMPEIKNPQKIVDELLRDDLLAAEGWKALSDHGVLRPGIDSDASDPEWLASAGTLSCPEMLLIYQAFSQFENDDDEDIAGKVQINGTTKGNSDNGNCLYELQLAVDSESKDVVVDFDKDISRWLFGRSAGKLLSRLTKPAAIFFSVFTFPSHMLSVILSQFWWTHAVYAFGYAVTIPFFLFLMMSMQQDLSIMLLKQAHTWYLLAATVVYVGSGAHKQYYELEPWNRATEIPTHVVVLIAFPCIAFADACHPQARRIALRYCSPFACFICSSVVARMHLPGAEQNPGLRTLWVFGVEQHGFNSEVWVCSCASSSERILVGMEEPR